MQKKIRVFLSRPNPFTTEQDYLIKQLKEFFNDMNIETITLEAQDYTPYESLTTLNEMIRRCYGMVILAFGQTFIQNGTVKKGAIKEKNFFDSEEKDLSDIWVTSAFCQIEGAIAISNDIPILIVKEEHLKIEGILKEDNKIFHVPSFHLNSKECIDNYIKNVLEKNIRSWYECIRKKYDNIEKYIV